MAHPTTVEKGSPADLQIRLDARADSIRRHLAALRHELTSASSFKADFEAAGRPALDEVREHPERSLMLSAGAGAAVGALLGLSAWRQKRKEVRSQAGAARMALASLLGGASGVLAKGKRTDEAIKQFAEKHGPLVVYANAPSPTKGSIHETLDLAVKTALGFGVKTGMDLLTKKLTGKPEVFQAAKDATESPPPERPYG